VLKGFKPFDLLCDVVYHVLAELYRLWCRRLFSM